MRQLTLKKSLKHTEDILKGFRVSPLGSGILGLLLETAPKSNVGNKTRQRKWWSEIQLQ